LIASQRGWSLFSIATPFGKNSDNSAGHARLESLIGQFEAESIVVGVESTGGLENNWLRFFHLHLGDRAEIYRLNPLSVHKFLEFRDLHRAVDDVKSAEGIAMFLMAEPTGLRQYRPELDEAVRQFRFIKQQQKRQTILKTQLKNLLVITHPELVRFARGKLSCWLLDVLVKFPTTDLLAQADPMALGAIKGLTPKKARIIIEAAQNSVASARTDATATLIRSLATEVERLNELVKHWKLELCQLLQFREMEILCSIPGIGRWTAASLLLEVGDFTRFRSANALVAFCGLDPRPERSGDKVKQRGISRRGRRHVRGALYLPTLTCINFNSEMRAFYERLCSRGKHHYVAITACSAKLLRIAYACVTRDTPYIERTPRRQVEKKGSPQSILAPVSLKEAQKRKRPN